MAKIGIAPMKPFGGGFTVRCRCYWTTLPNYALLLRTFLKNACMHSEHRAIASSVKYIIERNFLIRELIQLTHNIYLTIPLAYQSTIIIPLKYPYLYLWRSTIGSHLLTLCQ